MKKTLILLFTYLAFSCVILAQDGKKATVAVTKIEVTKALSADMKAKGASLSLERVAQSLGDGLTAALQATRKFQMLARSDLDAIVKEQSLIDSGNSSEKKIAEIGKLKGAKYIVSVLVNDFQDNMKKDSFAQIEKKLDSRKIAIGIIVKIIDTTSGEIVETTDMSLAITRTNEDNASTTTQWTPTTDSAIGLISRFLCKKVAIKLADIAFPATIIAKTGKIVTINRNDAMGINIGDEYEIYALGEKMFDPGTGDELGYEEINVGKLRIISVNDKFSRGEIFEDNGVAKGQNIRPIIKQKPSENNEI